MANVDNPHGLAPLMRSLSGGPPAVSPFTKDSGCGTAIFLHDVVQRDADGNISPGVTTPLVGVALTGGAASKETEHLVMVDPHAVYEAQDDADVDGFALLDMGANCNVAANAGSAITGLSGHELDEGSADVTATLHVHLIRLFPVLGNAFGAHARIEINFNTAALGSGMTGIAAG